VIEQLGRLGFHSVWLEAGGKLFNAIHEAHLVNRTHIYLVPRILGDNTVSAYQQANILNQPQMVSWTPMGDNIIATLDWEQPCLQV
jgi:diaminohydroxyphosphoribosylaminopyrimidine deaminase/5-amino-6-(5-phosphoribosylamino)uracil reductase